MSLTANTFLSFLVVLLVLDAAVSNVHQKRRLRLKDSHNLCQEEPCKKEYREKESVGCKKGEPCLNSDKTVNKRETECHPGEGCDRSIERQGESMERDCQPHERECKKKRTFNKARQEKSIASDPGCPAGFKCSRSLSEIEAAKLGFENSLSLRECPPGRLCKHDMEANEKISPRQKSSRSLSLCPPGLWCKRSLSKLQAKKLGFQNSLGLRDCPPGLWCKRKASISLNDCPPGLWCKRGLDKSSAMAMGFENADTMGECPPGLWCKRGEYDTLKTFSDLRKKPNRCPPGLWCKRDFSSNCPPGLWCKREFSLSCPPGLWCKRDLSLSDEKISSGSLDKTSSKCPPGLWCKRDSDGDLDGFEDGNVKCPPGLWCKRDSRFSLCPKGHLCNRRSKKYDVIAELLER